MRDTNKIYILSQGGMNDEILEDFNGIPWSEEGLHGLLEPDNFFNGDLHGLSDEQGDNSTPTHQRLMMCI